MDANSSRDDGPGIPSDRAVGKFFQDLIYVNDGKARTQIFSVHRSDRVKFERA